MVSEWLSGQSLAERVETGGPLAAWEAVELALALTRGVAAAHERGVLHRDVKARRHRSCRHQPRL